MYKEHLMNSIDLSDKSEKKVERTTEYINEISDNDDEINIITEINFLKACLKYYNAIDSDSYNNNFVDNIFFIVCAVLIIILQAYLLIWSVVYLSRSVIRIIKKDKLYLVSGYVGKILYILIPLILTIKAQDLVYIGYETSDLGSMYSIVLIGILSYILITAIIKALYYNDEYKYIVDKLVSVIVVIMSGVCILAGLSLSDGGIIISTYSVATIMYGEYYYDVEELKEDEEYDISLDEYYNYDDGYTSYEERLKYVVEDYDDYKKSTYIDVIGNIVMRIGLLCSLSIMLKMYSGIVTKKNSSYILSSIINTAVYVIGFILIFMGGHILVGSYTDEYTVYSANRVNISLVICLVVSALSIFICALKKYFNKSICKE
ncbi:MAG: hypothetical protein E7269_01860 [Lachnospiraceae bacterium]|nr:hypothetical protein [Lachnospiraceae bacterium]